ncbi:hypothetical protein V8C26DRAFT_411033 [Trichoderma gracile]
MKRRRLYSLAVSFKLRHKHVRLPTRRQPQRDGAGTVRSIYLYICCPLSITPPFPSAKKYQLQPNVTTHHSSRSTSRSTTYAIIYEYLLSTTSKSLDTSNTHKPDFSHPAVKPIYLPSPLSPSNTSLTTVFPSVRVSICNPLTNSPTSHMQIANHICTDNSANKQQKAISPFPEVVLLPVTEKKVEFTLYITAPLQQKKKKRCLCLL